MKHHFALLLLALAATSATATTTTYTVDPDHTHPSFEVDHFGGLSIWRGTFKKTSGTVRIDTAAKSGAVDIVIDTSTVDFAHDKLNEHVSSPEVLDVAKYPTAEYKGKFVEFADGAPKTIAGDLTLHGITKPVTLTINSFKCQRQIQPRRLRRELRATVRVQPGCAAAHPGRRHQGELSVPAEAYLPATCRSSAHPISAALSM